MTSVEKRQKMLERIGRSSWELEKIMREWRSCEAERKRKAIEEQEREEYEKKFRTLKLFDKEDVSKT